MDLNVTFQCNCYGMLRNTTVKVEGIIVGSVILALTSPLQTTVLLNHVSAGIC